MTELPLDEVRRRVKEHADKERTTFSLAGIRALLNALDATPASSAAPTLGDPLYAAYLTWLNGDDGDTVIASLREVLPDINDHTAGMAVINVARALSALSALASPSAEAAQPVATVRHPNFSAGDLKRLAELPPGTALYALSQPQGELREALADLV
jgi:hypothetical protein